MWFDGVNGTCFLGLERERGAGWWKIGVGFSGGASGKEPVCHCRIHRR